MTFLGKINNLKILKEKDFGLYLDGEELGEILIPKRYVPEGVKIGESLDVFIYLDSEDRLIATTEKPLAQVGDFALLKVVSVNQTGAFLDWGLPKNLMVPFREQKQPMEEGRSYVVKVYVDKETNRIVASAKLDNFLDNIPPEYEEGAEVELFIVSETDLGYKAIINGFHWGMLYRNEVFQKLNRGQKLTGYIKKVRTDGKIDLTLLKQGYEKVAPVAQKILEYIKQKGGFISFTDKTAPEIIYATFGVSKKVFKSAIGSLYRNGLIVIGNDGLTLTDEQGE